jgi:hypothetical protein
VVQAEQVVVDDALDEVEEAEAHQHRARQQLPRPAHMGAVRPSPQHDQAEQDEDVGSGMKEPVPERVDLQVRHAVGRITRAGEHVVPLEHLMQHDAVEEAAEAKAEQDSGRDRELPVLASRIAHRALLAVALARGARAADGPTLAGAERPGGKRTSVRRIGRFARPAGAPPIHAPPGQPLRRAGRLFSSFRCSPAARPDERVRRRGTRA